MKTEYQNAWTASFSQPTRKCYKSCIVANGLSEVLMARIWKT